MVVTKDAGSRLREAEAQARSFLDSGDFQHALHLRMQAVALAKLSVADPTAASVEPPEVVALAHLRLSDVYHYMGYAEQVCWHAQKAIDLCVARSGRDSNDTLVSAYHFMAKGWLLKRGPSQSLHYLQKALSMNLDLHGEEDVSNADLHISFSDYHVMLEEIAQNNFKVRRSPTRSVDAATVISMNGCDNYKKAIAELDKAAQLIENAESTTEDLDKPFEAVSLQSNKANIDSRIAQIHAKQGNFWQAAKQYEKALRYQMVANPKNTVALANLRHELGVLYKKLEVES